MVATDLSGRTSPVTVGDDTTTAMVPVCGGRDGLSMVAGDDKIIISPFIIDVTYPNGHGKMTSKLFNNMRLAPGNMDVYLDGLYHQVDMRRILVDEGYPEYDPKNVPMIDKPLSAKARTRNGIMTVSVMLHDDKNASPRDRVLQVIYFCTVMYKTPWGHEIARVFDKVIGL